MSLINDAIKRAHAAKPGAPAPGTTHLHLEPVPLRRSPRWPLLVMPLLLAGLVSLGVVFILKGWLVQRDNPLPVSAREGGPAVRAPDAPTAPAHPGLETVPATDPAQLADTPLAVSAPAGPPEPVVPTFPDLQLKGIYYRPSNPSAVINNKTVFVGERINQAQVLGITADSVTVMWNDETRVLTMQ